MLHKAGATYFVWFVLVVLMLMFDNSSFLQVPFVSCWWSEWYMWKSFEISKECQRGGSKCILTAKVLSKGWFEIHLKFQMDFKGDVWKPFYNSNKFLHQLMWHLSVRIKQSWCVVSPASLRSTCFRNEVALGAETSLPCGPSCRMWKKEKKKRAWKACTH